MSTLYITDLDGTLFGSDSRISGRSASMLSDAIGRGAFVTVATARTPATADLLLRGVGFNLPIIVMTGCGLWNQQTHKWISVRQMSAATALDVYETLSRRDVWPFVYTLEPGATAMRVWHPGPMSRKDSEFYAERRNLDGKSFSFEPVSPGVLSSNVILQFASGATDPIAEAGRALAATTDATVSVYADIFDSQSSMIEVLPPGVSKAGAVEALAAKMRREHGTDRVVVFGDNLNDIPMMKVADLAVAVENALPEVKEAADIVIGPNTADSVARFIYEDFDAR